MLVHKVHGGARHFYTLCKRSLVHAKAVIARAAERGDEAGVNIENFIRVGRQHPGAYHREIPRQHHHVNAMALQKAAKRRVVRAGAFICLSGAYNRLYTRFGRALQRIGLRV